ncbi:MAG: Rid family detoxifying hydrolase [Candidatus Marinimicrobia bacterium]|jgi:2-iminobutanoate/2-iminopropanoate deaminase|nr:Rid family detoxifying hydrolase [Candidatus Neomarinimicrobiota bacterium]
MAKEKSRIKEPIRELIQTKNAPGAVGTYSQAVSAGGFLYTSGQIGINPASGKIESSDTKSQSLQALHNIAAILNAKNLSLVNIVKLTVYLKDLNDFSDLNESFKDFFGATNFPARSTVEVAGLPLGARVEIDCVAIES